MLLVALRLAGFVHNAPAHTCLYVCTCRLNLTAADATGESAQYTCQLNTRRRRSNKVLTMYVILNPDFPPSIAHAREVSWEELGLNSLVHAWMHRSNLRTTRRHSTTPTWVSWLRTTCGYRIACLGAYYSSSGSSDVIPDPLAANRNTPAPSATHHSVAQTLVHAYNRLPRLPTHHHQASEITAPAKRTPRHQETLLLAEQEGHAILQPGHRGILAEHVVPDRRSRHGLPQPLAGLRHRVAAEVHHRRRRSTRGSCSTRRAGCSGGGRRAVSCYGHGRTRLLANLRLDCNSSGAGAGAGGVLDPAGSVATAEVYSPVCACSPGEEAGHHALPMWCKRSPRG